MVSSRQSQRIQNKPQYRTGTKIRKYFDVAGFAGWYEGEVLDIWQNEDTHVWQYSVRYSDGDREDIDEQDMKELVENFVNEVGVEPPEPVKTKNRKGKRTIATPTATRAKTVSKKKAKPAPRTMVVARPSAIQKSSLWQLVVDLKNPVQEIHALAGKNPPKNLPDEFHPCLANLIEFYLFVLERQHIQQGKQSDIVLFQTHHWCNNYRELDRGTAYFRSEILKLQQALVREHALTREQYILEVLAMSYYYRTCNKIESFLSSPVNGIPRIGQFNQAFVEHAISLMETPDYAFFTAAHNNQGIDKYLQACQETAAIGQVAAEVTLAAAMGGFHLEAICKTLRTLKNVADFTAWQMACDLEEACCFGPKLDQDGELVQGQDDYCLLGPGAKEGLVCIFGASTCKGNDTLELTKHVRDNLHDCLALVGKTFPLWKNRPVTLKVIEHALCEFQKFKQLDAGRSRGQRLYKSRAPSLDKKVDCASCSTGRLIRCDTCHLTVCGRCDRGEFHHIGMDAKSGSSWNCCRRCHDLDQLILE